SDAMPASDAEPPGADVIATAPDASVISDDAASPPYPDALPPPSEQPEAADSGVRGLGEVEGCSCSTGDRATSKIPLAPLLALAVIARRRRGRSRSRRGYALGGERERSTVEARREAAEIPKERPGGCGELDAAFSPLDAVDDDPR